MCWAVGVCAGYIGAGAVLVDFGMLGCACVNPERGGGGEEGLDLVDSGLVWFFGVCELGRGGVNLVNSGILGCVCVTWVGCGGGLGGKGAEVIFFWEF